MKTLRFETREAWMEARKRKITGSGLKDITLAARGGGPKIGFYKMIAERVAVDPDGQNPMERGTELEEEAIKRFEAETGKTVDQSLVLWSRDDNPDIAISPDGVISDEEAVENKCLSSALHIKALLTNEVPDEYHEQKIQYFVVNEKLQKLYFCFYDPRLAVKQFFYITVTRDEVQNEVDYYLEVERKVLEDVARIVNQLSF